MSPLNYHICLHKSLTFFSSKCRKVKLGVKLVYVCQEKQTVTWDSKVISRLLSLSLKLSLLQYSWDQCKNAETTQQSSIETLLSAQPNKTKIAKDYNIPQGIVNLPLWRRWKWLTPYFCRKKCANTKWQSSVISREYLSATLDNKYESYEGRPTLFLKMCDSAHDVLQYNIY